MTCFHFIDVVPDATSRYAFQLEPAKLLFDDIDVATSLGKLWSEKVEHWCLAVVAPLVREVVAATAFKEGEEGSLILVASSHESLLSFCRSQCTVCSDSSGVRFLTLSYTTIGGRTCFTHHRDFEAEGLQLRGHASFDVSGSMCFSWSK